jgi:anti-sigma B factor antagonist
MLEGHESEVRIDRRRAGAMAIVAPHGDLDLATAPALLTSIDAALAESPLILAIDLRGVGFMDGAAIGTLIDVGQRCSAEGRRMLLVRGSARIDRLISACGLDGHFDVVPGLDHLPAGEPADLAGLEPG